VIRPIEIRTGIPEKTALLILSGLMIFSPLIDGGTTHLPVVVMRLVLLAALTAWFMASMRSGSLAFYRCTLYIPIFLFLAWSILSVIQSSYTAPSLQWLISLLSYAALLFLVLHLLKSTRGVRGLIGVILGMGIFEAALGMYQFFWLGHERATGTFFNPNFFGTYEMAVFVVAFSLVCFTTRAGRGQTFLIWLTLVLVGGAFILAQSRGASLALIAAVGFVGFYRFGKRFVATLLLGIITLAMIPNPLQQRIMAVRVQDPYAFTRLEIWQNSVQRVIDHPFGVGLGLYQYSSFQYRFPLEDAIARYAKRAESAHNGYLHIAVELGLPGLLIVLVGMGLIAMKIKNRLSNKLVTEERAIAVGLSGGIIGILVHTAFDSVLHEPALVLLLALFVGMIFVLDRREIPAESMQVVTFPYHPIRVALVAVFVTFLALLIIRPAAAWYAFQKGGEAVAQNRMDLALERYRLAARIDPGRSTYHDALASAELHRYRQSGDVVWLHGAVSDLSVGWELNPLDGRLANRLGYLHLLMADRADMKQERKQWLGQAVFYYEQAIQADPYSPFNYLELGKLRWAQGNPEEAQASFERAVRHEPNFLPARVLLVELALKHGRQEDADLEYETILKIKNRYQGRVLTRVEQQFLEIDGHGLTQLRTQIKHS
jgi:putative inorganic carbon (HCO3(-)) transporter